MSKPKKPIVVPPVGTILLHSDKTKNSLPAKVVGVDEAGRFITVYRPGGRRRQTRIQFDSIDCYQVVRAEDYPDTDFSGADDADPMLMDLTPVEIAASVPELEKAPPPPAPASPAVTPAPSSEPSVHVTLRGPTAQMFSRQLTLLNNAAALTGGSPMTADDLVSKAVARLVSQVMGGAL